MAIVSIPDSDDDTPPSQTQTKPWLVDKPHSKGKELPPKKLKTLTAKKEAAKPSKSNPPSDRKQVAAGMKFKPANMESDDDEDEDEDEEGDENDDVDALKDVEGDELSESDDEDDGLDDAALQLEKPTITGSRGRKSNDDEPQTPVKKRQSMTLPSSNHTSVANIFDDDDDDGDISSPLKGKTKPLAKRPRSPAGDDEEVDSPVKVKKKSRRDDAFKQEKPRVKVSPLKKKIAALSPRKRRSAKNLIIGNPRPWPPHTLLVYNEGSTEVALLKQNVLIRRVARQAIKSVTEHLVLERAWEKDVGDREGYGPKALRKACRAILAQYPQAKDVYNRLKQDEVFASHLATIPLDRLSSLRAPAKSEADVCISYFKLGLGDESKARVEQLYETHGYVFPGVWGGPEANTWIPDRKKPYGNPTLAHVLKAGFFRSSSATGAAHADRFPVHEDTGKREVPKSLLALAATGVYAALFQVQQGTQKRVRFHANSFATVYNSHILALEMMEAKKPSSYHRIVSNLYNEVHGADEVSGNDDIYAVCELSD
ncbi:hypothetical protein NMY22_g18611 [Coprinellus aureogranulatus]|nr:hypothetical protein NMY22_g18611 [Coprinellus aureogranulatus]